MKCSVDGCPEQAWIRKRELCRRHYRDWWRTERTQKPSLTVECQRCGESFEARRPHQKYCSAKCSGQRQGIECAACGGPMQNSRTTLPEGHAVCRPCRRANPVPYGRRDGSPTVAISCPICGESFIPQIARIRTCSRSCGQKLRTKRAPVESTWRGRACEVCGKTYNATYSKQRTCGRECGAVLNFRERPVSLKRKHPKWYAAGPASPVWFPDCVECGRTFTARTGRSRVCSDECRAARRAASEREARIASRRDRHCACGVEIATTRLKCDDCLREARRERRRRRRARERGAISESYTLAEIAARDRNRCGLCRKRVAMTKQVPHPKAPTIDHVVPLSDGGDDTKANTQLAHFICNSLKSAGGSQQLALVG